jgi:hypothetical protein
MELTSLGKFKFKIPIEITSRTEYEEDLKCDWIVLENKEIAIIGSGRTVDEALENLEGHLEGLVFGCLIFPDIQCSNSSIRIKRDLGKYLNIEDYRELCEEDDRSRLSQLWSLLQSFWPY